MPFGTVIVDDFHRLSDEHKLVIADLMKTLADEGSAHSKLVVLGITNAGQALIAFGKDLSNRIEIIPFEANPEYKVEELLVKGETALHARLNVLGDIVHDAQGSFYIARCLRTTLALRQTS